MIFGFAYLLIISQYYGDYIATRLKPSENLICFRSGYEENNPISVISNSG